ncbi:MAG: DUF4254 domain-containing protein [Pirellulales bacterium]|nr:DUF4254 domain-containing protein [Pirellulales bacterium]
MINVHAITRLHETTVRRWHQSDIDNAYEGFLGLVCRQHQQNYRLWHQEDIARSLEVADAELAQVKRNIDRLNQQRNDLIEQLDDSLIGRLASVGVVPLPEARLNSETPGSVIDRLSILALRIYHMEEESRRADAGEAHQARAKAKLETLHEQHADLSTSLSEQIDDIFSGRRRLKVYRQFKMYNDPTMNPYLYCAQGKPAA